MDRDQALKHALELHKRSREDFSKAHQDGMAALKRRDYRALSQAVEQEGSAIAATGEALQQLNDRIKAHGK
jgi:hypothetical protein